MFQAYVLFTMLYLVPQFLTSSILCSGFGYLGKSPTVTDEVVYNRVMNQKEVFSEGPNVYITQHDTKIFIWKIKNPYGLFKENRIISYKPFSETLSSEQNQVQSLNIFSISSGLISFITKEHKSHNDLETSPKS